MCYERKKKHSACVSKLNSAREKQAIIPMISNEEGWFHIAIKVLGGITPKI